MVHDDPAHRDEEQFARPDEFDITRADTGNVAFGRGIHYCLGGPLARLEGRIALEVLLERFSEIRFGSRPPAYQPNVVLRGLSHLDIRVRRRGIIGASASSHADPPEAPV
ncbi:MAG: cytochrome P450 [Nitrospinae bacterium]|nr:cytochrome P450 [Nitrospinota bacterium]